MEDQLPEEGVHDLLVKMEDAYEGTAEDVIRCVFEDSAYQMQDATSVTRITLSKRGRTRSARHATPPD